MKHANKTVVSAVGGLFIAASVVATILTGGAYAAVLGVVVGSLATVAGLAVAAMRDEKKELEISIQKELENAVEDQKKGTKKGQKKELAKKLSELDSKIAERIDELSELYKKENPITQWTDLKEQKQMDIIEQRAFSDLLWEQLYAKINLTPKWTDLTEEEKIKFIKEHDLTEEEKVKFIKEQKEALTELYDKIRPTTTWLDLTKEKQMEFIKEQREHFIPSIAYEEATSEFNSKYSGRGFDQLQSFLKAKISGEKEQKMEKIEEIKKTNTEIANPQPTTLKSTADSIKPTIAPEKKLPKTPDPASTGGKTMNTVLYKFNLKKEKLSSYLSTVKNEMNSKRKKPFKRF